MSKDREEVRAFIRDIMAQNGYTKEPILTRADELLAARMHNTGLEYAAMEVCLVSQISQRMAQWEAEAPDREARKAMYAECAACTRMCEDFELAITGECPYTKEAGV